MPLALTRREAVARGIRPIRITCDDDNAASIKIIEDAGGVPDGTDPSPESGKLVRQYWLPADS